MFSKATEYALRAVIFIAQKSSEQQKLGLAEIADAIQSPQFFTAKILQKLTLNNQVISSVRGPNGGFFITESAKQKSVKSIVEVMGEGELFDKCVLGLNRCSEKNPCPMHDQYKPIRENFIYLFDHQTIEEMAHEMNSGSFFIRNDE
ncbi:RrF2 family transcriptional regulator [Aquirufa aurantiipilula]|uniref:Rrf2 family transcriptional regulator n=1 Tax=Aquirufa aurantiipilula TaxID=2696561 RepID=A0ABT6BGB3_9BACT|nr:Rrf2 family transcriptional regulator [Aquirufa aurantiipilula]MBZ1326366.1 Rrf2 family transcriptional regulator [Aquirufa aurantiipilula]MDF5689454.1 Rrf2 family transcriptional regulator [Aquirufa aurantiipilula]